MGHFKTFYMSDTFCANAYFLRYNTKTAGQRLNSFVWE